MVGVYDYFTRLGVLLCTKKRSCYNLQCFAGSLPEKTLEKNDAIWYNIAYQDQRLLQGLMA